MTEREQELEAKVEELAGSIARGEHYANLERQRDEARAQLSEVERERDSLRERLQSDAAERCISDVMHILAASSGMDEHERVQAAMFRLGEEHPHDVRASPSEPSDETKPPPGYAPPSSGTEGPTRGPAYDPATDTWDCSCCFARYQYAPRGKCPMCCRVVSYPTPPDCIAPEWVPPWKRARAWKRAREVIDANGDVKIVPTEYLRPDGTAPERGLAEVLRDIVAPMLGPDRAHFLEIVSRGEDGERLCAYAVTEGRVTVPELFEMLEEHGHLAEPWPPTRRKVELHPSLFDTARPPDGMPGDPPRADVLDEDSDTFRRLVARYGRDEAVRQAALCGIHPAPPTPPRAPIDAERPYRLTWNGTEWIDGRCGCRYHPDDDNGSHGGAPHVHRCERHAIRPPDGTSLAQLRDALGVARTFIESEAKRRASEGQNNDALNVLMYIDECPEIHSPPNCDHGFAVHISGQLGVPVQCGTCKMVVAHHNATLGHIVSDGISSPPTDPPDPLTRARDALVAAARAIGSAISLHPRRTQYVLLDASAAVVRAAVEADEAIRSSSSAKQDGVSDDERIILPTKPPPTHRGPPSPVILRLCIDLMTPGTELHRVVNEYAHLARPTSRCPKCDKDHYDEGEWATRLHRTHRCVDDSMSDRKGCGHEWMDAEAILQTQQGTKS